MKQPINAIYAIRCLAAALLIAGPGAVLAQGGPPLVTDDPDTPGDGHWEVNLAAIGTRTPGRWEVAAPDADINYGWGEHIQLKADVPWVYAHDTGSEWKSGLGAPVLGVKWRFLDREDSGFSMSTYPQYEWTWLQSSVTRGITSDEKQFLLPVEVSTIAGSFSLDAEFGRNFVRDGTNQWIAGGIVAHACGADVECLAEIHEVLEPQGARTLLNLGVHWKLAEDATLLAAAGHELATTLADRQQVLLYLGVQLTR